MKTIILTAITVTSILQCSIATANAETYIYDFTYDGTTLTTNSSASGSQLNISDIVEVTFRASGDNYWSADESDDNIWPAIAVSPSAGRIGTYSWIFYLDGSLVDEGLTANDLSEYIHIINYTYPSKSIEFDQLFISYDLDSEVIENGGPTILGSLLFPDELLSPAVYHVVPVPSAILLLGTGFAGLSALGRKRKHQ